MFVRWGPRWGAVAIGARPPGELRDGQEHDGASVLERHRRAAPSAAVQILRWHEVTGGPRVSADSGNYARGSTAAAAGETHAEGSVTSGSRRVNFDPFPGSLATRLVPWCCFMMA